MPLHVAAGKYVSVFMSAGATTRPAGGLVLVISLEASRLECLDRALY